MMMALAALGIAKARDRMLCGTALRAARVPGRIRHGPALLFLRAEELANEIPGNEILKSPAKFPGE